MQTAKNILGRNSSQINSENHNMFRITSESDG